MLKKIRKKKWTRSEKFLLLAAMPLYFILVGLLVQPVSTILPGLWIIIREPDVLITDYFVVGGIGAAFINAGILTLLCLFIVYKSGLDVDGHTVTSTFLMFGFSLFGKNLLNIWMILLGVWFYAKYHKTAPSRYIYIALYGTSLSPIITQMMQIEYNASPVKSISFYVSWYFDRLRASSTGNPCPLRPSGLLPV